MYLSSLKDFKGRLTSIYKKRANHERTFYVMWKVLASKPQAKTCLIQTFLEQLGKGRNIESQNIKIRKSQNIENIGQNVKTVKQVRLH